MTNTRTKLITAGLFAAAAIALPACSVSVTPGTPVASSTDRAAYLAEKDAVTPANTPAANTTPVEIPAKYSALVDAIEYTSNAAEKFMADEGLPMDDVVLHGAMESDDIPQCQPSKFTSDTQAWACSINDPRDIVFHIPHMYTIVYVPYGNVGVAIVAAHEYGHLALPMMRRAADTNDRMEERRADCVSGAFMAWYSRNGGPTASQVRNVLEDWYPDRGNQRAMDRVAIEYGWNNGLAKCATYDDGFGN